MSPHDLNIEAQENEKLGVVEAYKGTITSIFRFASSVFGLSMLAYVLGWMRADSYFSTIGAGWITNDLTVSYIYSLSYLPILSILFGIVITFSDLSKEFSRKTEIFIWILMGLTMILSNYLAFLYGLKGNYVQSVYFYKWNIIGLAMFFGLIFGDVSIELLKLNFKWTIQNITKLIFWIVLFLFSVGSLGNAEGKRDLNVNQSRLDVVEKKDGEVLRLLFQKDGLIYAATIEKNIDPKVTILSHEEIHFIQRSLINGKNK